MPLYATVAILVLIALLLHVADKRKEQADDRRIRKLVALAKKTYPRNAVTESLGELYMELYQKIVEANIHGQSIDRLRHDRELIAEETCRIWREEIDRKRTWTENQSFFQIIKRSTPRQSASALTGTSD